MDSVTWWNSVKGDSGKFNEWLQKQYYGEMKAAERIAELVPVFNLSGKEANIVSLIAAQEAQHAQWVGELLTTRGVIPKSEHTERYWEQTGLTFDSAVEAFAVASHAENMRLERIRAIVDDVEAPKDVRDVFIKILKDEVFHESAFKELTTSEAYEAARESHVKGRLALGLEA